MDLNKDDHNPVQGSDDTKTIADIYYRQKSAWINSLLLRKEASEIYEENGRLIQNITVKMNETKKTIKPDNHLEFEEILKVEDLRELKKRFSNRIKTKLNKLNTQEYIFDRNKRKFAESLNENDFLEILKTLPFYNDFEQELQKLFQRIDHANLGHINWSDVSNYFSIRLRESEFTELLKTKLFNIQPKIKLCEHNKREITVKVLKIENPFRFVNISRRGAVGIWTKNLNLIKSFQINPLTNQLTNSLMDRKTKNTMWIKDVVLLPELNKICIATTKRDLRFFLFSSENLNEEFKIYNLPTEPTCLEYFYDNENKKSYLYFGDESGRLNIITFKYPHIGFFDKTKNKKSHSALEIRWKVDREGRFEDHEDFIHYSNILVSDGNLIESLKIIPFNKTIVVSTASYNKSLVILDPESKKKEYTFSLYDSCSCFDINMPMHILVTASNHSPIYIWDVYSPNKPISRLEIPGRRVISLKIHYPIGYLYSLTSNSVVEVWDLKDDNLVQTVELHFPIANFIQFEFEPFTMSLFINDNENNLVITCKDYIAHLVLGENYRLASSVPLTANCAITCMAYSSLFKIIITCAEDSTITFWNLLNGAKLFTIPNAHDKEEITECTLDRLERNLFTGALSGTIKVWNVANGQLMQSYDTQSDTEITGLTLLDKKRLMIVVGTNKKIISFTDLKFESLEPSPPKHLFGGIDQHNDEILCSDLFMNLLATGGRDGEIKIWSIDKKRLFMIIRDKNEEYRPAVDRLLFIKQTSSLESTILISSEEGFLNFWKLDFKKDRLLGRFYASRCADQLTFSLTTNKEETILISGDTKGFLYLWDISKTKNSKDQKTFEKPECLKTWRCHDSTIVSCQYIPSFLEGLENDLIVTASSDWCCRVWTENGDYIGSFGQEKKWKLTNQKTYVSNDEINLEQKNEQDQANEEVKIENLNHSSHFEKHNGSKFDYLDSLKFFKSIKKDKTPYFPKLIVYDVDKHTTNQHSSQLSSRHSDYSYSKLSIHDLEQLTTENVEKALYSRASSVLL